MAIYKVLYNATLKTVIVRNTADSIPSGSVSLGNIDDVSSIDETELFELIDRVLKLNKISDVVTIVKHLGGSVPAPVFTTNPSIVISKRSGGYKRYGVSPGKANNVTKYSYQWLLDGTLVSTRNFYDPNASGNLILRTTAVGPGGNTVIDTNAVAIVANPIVVQVAKLPIGWPNNIGGSGTPPPTPGAYYVDTTGSDAAAGTIGAPFATIAKAMSVAGSGSTVYLQSGKTWTEPMVVPSGVTVEKLGTDVDPVLNGFVSVKGSTGDWSEVSATDGVTASPGSKVWRRTDASYTGQKLLVTDATTTTYAGMTDFTGFTNWKEVNTVDVNALGRWYLGAGFLLVYSDTNPASAFTSLRLSSLGTAVDMSAATGAHVKNLTVRGFANGFDYGTNCVSTDAFATQCAGFGHRFTKPNNGTITRPRVWDCGGSSVTDHEDYQSNGIVFAGDSGALAYFENMVIENLDVDRTRDDLVHNGGNTNGNNPASRVTFRSSVPGATWITRNQHGENGIDNNQNDSGVFRFEEAYIASNNAPRADIVPNSLIHNYGDGVELYRCAVNMRANASGSFALYNRRGGKGFTVINSIIGGNCTVAPNQYIDGGTLRFIGNIFYAPVGSLNPIRITDGDAYLERNTTLEGGSAVLTARVSRATLLAASTFTRSASPDGDGNYEYTMFCSNTTNFIREGHIEIAGASGASAALNGYWDTVADVVPSGSQVRFKVPASASPPSSVDKTGMLLYTASKIRTMLANYLTGAAGGFDIANYYHRPEVITGNALWDNAGGDQSARNRFAYPAGVVANDGTSRNYTKVQVTASIGAGAGNLAYDTNGEMGGTGWNADDTDGDVVIYKTATSVVISGGIATYTFGSAHGFVAGDLLYVKGATPGNLNGAQFVLPTGLTATVLKIRVERGVADQTATGTIKLTDGTPTVGSPARLTAAGNLYTLPNVSAYATVDIKRNALPATGWAGAVAQ